MAQAKVMHGSRALLSINGKKIGIFNSVSYGMAYDAQAVHILGRFSPAEIVYTGQEPIAISATGFRILDNGPHKAAGLPALQDLLNHGEIEMSITDRQTNTAIMKVVGVRPTGFSTGLSARAVQEITVNFIGLRISDETVTNAEEATAANISSDPDPTAT